MAGRFDPVRDSVTRSPSSDERRSVSAEEPRRKQGRSASIADILNEENEPRTAGGVHYRLSSGSSHSNHPSAAHYQQHVSPSSSATSRLPHSATPTMHGSPSSVQRDLPQRDEMRYSPHGRMIDASPHMLHRSSPSSITSASHQPSPSLHAAGPIRSERSPSLFHMLNSGTNVDDQRRPSSSGSHGLGPPYSATPSGLSPSMEQAPRLSGSRESVPHLRADSMETLHHHHHPGMHSQHWNNSRSSIRASSSIGSASEFAVPDVPNRSPESMRSRMSLPHVSHSPSFGHAAHPSHAYAGHPEHESYLGHGEHGLSSVHQRRPLSPSGYPHVPSAPPHMERPGSHPLHITTGTYPMPPSPAAAAGPLTPYSTSSRSPMRFPPTPGDFAPTPGEYMGQPFFSSAGRALGESIVGPVHVNSNYSPSEPPRSRFGPQVHEAREDLANSGWHNVQRTYEGERQTDEEHRHARHLADIRDRQASQQIAQAREEEMEARRRLMFMEEVEARRAAEMREEEDARQHAMLRQEEEIVRRHAMLVEDEKARRRFKASDDEEVRRMQELRRREEMEHLRPPPPLKKRKSAATIDVQDVDQEMEPGLKQRAAAEKQETKAQRFGKDEAKPQSGVQERQDGDASVKTRGKIVELPTPPPAPVKQKRSGREAKDVTSSEVDMNVETKEEPDDRALPYKPATRVSVPGVVRIPIMTGDLERMRNQGHNPLRQKWKDEHPGRSDGWEAIISAFEAGQRKPRSALGMADATAAVKKRKRATGDNWKSDEPQAQTDMNSTLVAAHYNSRQDVGLGARKQSPILPLRNFNNWIKSVLIQMFGRRGGRTFDIGGGKGGDLLKWDKCGVRELVLADIADVSVAQARDRYNERRHNFHAEFFAMDCFGEPLADHIPRHILEPMFDNVSLQFCLHYGWNSVPSAQLMLENVARYLKPGGTFIGTMPGCDQLRSRLELARKADPSARTFGNHFYKVEFDEVDTGSEPLRFRPFGQRYTFNLLDAIDEVAEYVVDWEQLESLAGQNGMTCIYKRTFAEIWQDEGNSPGPLRDLARRMGIRLGSEVPMDAELWEAVTIYTAFAFEKNTRP